MIKVTQIYFKFIYEIPFPNKPNDIMISKRYPLDDKNDHMQYRFWIDNDRFYIIYAIIFPDGMCAQILIMDAIILNNC